MPDPIYVIPDIHGQQGLLKKAIALIEQHGGYDAQVVFLGDLVDRGLRSREVIQSLMYGVETGRNWTVLRGNHDQVFVDFINAAPYLAPFEFGHGWLDDNMGGTETLESYGVNITIEPTSWFQTLKAVPKDHVAFLTNLPLWHETDDLLFVHAGIRPGVPMDEQDPHDLMWIREPFLQDTSDHGKLVVHGHTPIEQPQHYGNRINLDAGAAWGGPLSVAVFEGRDCWLLSEEGRTPLLPGPLPLVLEMPDGS